MAPLSPYHRRLFLFLSVASFFEGFDYIALGQVLPWVRRDMHLSPEAGTALVGIINIGMVLSYFLIRYADVWGRRRVMALTIGGYTISSVLTGLAPNVWCFGAAQLLARLFLLTELAVAMVYAAEEYPAERRGMVIGVIQACAGVGAALCSLVVPMLLKLPWGWRGVYFAGGIPLILVAIARRSLAETARFSAKVASGEVANRRISLLPGTGILRSSHRGRLLQLAAIWGLTFFCTQSAFQFWNDFAVSDRGFTAEQASHCITPAFMVALPLLFFTGKLLDLIGRRVGAALIFVLGAGGVVAAYSLHSSLALTVGLTIGIIGTMSALPVLHAFTTELFPTELRGDAYGWANNLLGRWAAVASPFVVGQLQKHFGWSVAMSLTAIPFLLALVLILATMPETRGRELEDIARS